MWEGHEDLHKNVAITVLDGAIAVDDASSRPMLVSSLVVDKDLLNTCDTVFDGVVGSSDDLGLRSNGFDIRQIHSLISKLRKDSFTLE